jgi:WXXGXW repeat (2 copies)
MRISNFSGPNEGSMTISNRATFKSVLLAATILATPLIAMAPLPAAAQTSVGLSVQIAPPMLPIYAQPPMPQSGYIWTPGYWDWTQATGYYWVPGTWILPPSVGMLWTPPYWGWADNAYLFHAGYWGPQVGYYGGVNYGYGYGGSGYQGGRWDGGNLVYNQTVNNFGSVHPAHVFSQKVTANDTTRVSYAGGAHGTKAAPTDQERSAEHDQHVPATAEQTKHIAAAAKSPALTASHNGGRPAIAATSHPGQFKGPGVVRAQPAAAGHAASRPASPPMAKATAAPRPAAAVHAAARPAPAVHAASRPAPAVHAAARPAPAVHAASRPAPAVHAAARPAPAVHAASRPAPAPMAKNTVAPRPAAAPAAAKSKEDKP